ncbi:MAG: redox-regulated ATPase YchF [Anaerolineae bacterium]|nr:redox-regulated ATPase YchF [Anaerolineae bacterium]
MRLGIIGLPNSGKTTIFNALTKGNLPTGAATSGQFEVHTAVVSVPDERVDRLSAMYNPKKTIYTQVTYVDIGGLEKGVAEGGLKGQFRNELAQVDGLVHVLRAFVDDNIPHPYDTVDPQRDLDIIEGEFLLSDLVMIESRLEKIAEEQRRKGRTLEKATADEAELLERLKTTLEQDTPLRDLDLTDVELKSVRGFGLLSLKPMLIVLNQGDEMRDYALKYDHKRSNIINLQGKIESELSQLDPEDAAIFMEEYGITELSADRVVRLSYELLAYDSFFTVGEDEVRAWRMPSGATAPEAAGVIHSDLQKGFIRAEVFHYDELMELGSENAIKSAGKLRLEGREYIVKDGDILHIRHSS